MTEIEKSTVRLTEHLIGGPVVWNGLLGEPRPEQWRDVATHSFVARSPVEITGRVWDKVEEDAEAIYRLIMEHIDWDRILIAACGLHLSHLNDEKWVEEHPDHILVEDLCGPCVLEALLSKER